MHLFTLSRNFFKCARNLFQHLNQFQTIFGKGVNACGDLESVTWRLSGFNPIRKPSWCFYPTCWGDIWSNKFPPSQPLAVSWQPKLISLGCFNLDLDFSACSSTPPPTGSTWPSRGSLWPPALVTCGSERSAGRCDGGRWGQKAGFLLLPTQHLDWHYRTSLD